MLDPEAWILSWAWGNPRKPAGPVPKLTESLIPSLWMGGERVSKWILTLEAYELIRHNEDDG